MFPLFSGSGERGTLIALTSPISTPLLLQFCLVFAALLGLFGEWPTLFVAAALGCIALDFWSLLRGQLNPLFPAIIVSLWWVVLRGFAPDATTHPFLTAVLLAFVTGHIIEIAGAAIYLPVVAYFASRSHRTENALDWGQAFDQVATMSDDDRRRALAELAVDDSTQKTLDTKERFKKKGPEA